jgi:hypothetical protein
MNAAPRIALALALAAQPATAAELKITDIKAYLYLEHAGKLSDNIVGAPPFENVAKGGGADHDPATAILFDLTFAGDKNASPKYATATVDVTQSGRSGQQIITHKAFTSFIFGADGIQHKAFLVENGTCMPIAVAVRANKSEKTVKLDFHCGE